MPAAGGQRAPAPRLQLRLHVAGGGPTPRPGRRPGAGLPSAQCRGHRPRRGPGGPGGGSGPRPGAGRLRPQAPGAPARSRAPGRAQALLQPAGTPEGERRPRDLPFPFACLPSSSPFPSFLPLPLFLSLSPLPFPFSLPFSYLLSFPFLPFIPSLFSFPSQLPSVPQGTPGFLALPQLLYLCAFS